MFISFIFCSWKAWMKIMDSLQHHDKLKMDDRCILKSSNLLWKLCHSLPVLYKTPLFNYFMINNYDEEKPW